MLVSALQPEKALFSIVVIVLGMSVFLHPLIILFADVSISALQELRESYFPLPFATVIYSRLLNPLNALFPIVVSVLGIDNCSKA